MFKTKLLLLFAVISYLLPVATILSPGALTGNLFSIRAVVTIVVNDPSTTLSNSSVPVLSALDNDVGFVRTGSAWSYLGSSDQLRRVAARVLTNGEISPFPSPCGSNCTYNITFLGLAYKCIRLAPSATLPNLTNTTDEINTSLSPSSGLVTFYAAELSGNLTVQGLWVAYGSMPNMTIQCTVDADMSFSQVLVATRNPSLDQICVGANLGGDQITEELKDSQLRFGMLLTGESPHPCFGLEGEINQLRNRGGGLVMSV
jgi:hypothetical protein